MTLAALVLALALLGVVPEAEPLDGRYIAARYAAGVMQRVAIKRGLTMGRCGISMDKLPLGSRVRVEGIRTGVARVCVVVDYSMPRDLKRHLKARQIELDDASAKDICSIRFYRSRPKECPVQVAVITRGA